MPITLTDEQYKQLTGGNSPGAVIPTGGGTVGGNGGGMYAPLPGSPEQAVLGAGTNDAAGATPAPPPASGAAGNNSAMAMDPYTGFAARYAPGTLQNTIYDNPFFILRDVFSGINESSPGYQALRDFGGDPLALFNIMAGANGTIAGGDQGAGAFVNFLADLYQNLGTPGGGGFNSRDLLRNIFGQDLENPKTTLGNILVAGDMGQQIRTLFNLARDTAGVSMNPLAASAYQAAIARAGDRYGNAQIGLPADQTTNMIDYIKKTMPWLAVT